jgi:UDP-GlcNAc:undecaprenyl-phosphate GlcNAc-1-phosphate transferase
MLIRDLGLALIAGLLSAGFTYGLKLFLTRRTIAMSLPRERDVHTRPIPRLGGIAVAVSFLLVVFGLIVWSPATLHFVNGRVVGVDTNLAGIIAGVLVLLVVGVIDDVHGLSPWLKLLFHFVAGGLLASSGVLIHHFTNPFGGEIELGRWADAFVILWVVFAINAVNWLDGLDGLASGISLIAAVILYILAIRPDVNQLSMSVLAIILSGALLGFLPFNFWPAQIFLGDSGSQVLGFLLATFAIISGGKLATAFLILGVPLLDTLWVIVRRLLTKQAPYKADRLHLHHRLLAAGLQQRDAVLLIYTIAAGFGIVALNTQSLGKLVASLSLIGMMIIGGLVLVYVPKLKQKAHE